MAKKEEKQSSIEETPWNMAMMYYLSLIKLIDKKDMAAINNDYVGWYRGLKAIYRRISFKLKKDKTFGPRDTTFLNEKFDRAKNIIFADRTRNQAVAAQVDFIVNSNAPEILDEIDIKLWEIMDRYSMIFPTIEIKGGLKSLADSYGIK